MNWRARPGIRQRDFPRHARGARPARGSRIPCIGRTAHAVLSRPWSEWTCASASKRWGLTDDHAKQALVLKGLSGRCGPMPTLYGCAPVERPATGWVPPIDRLQAAATEAGLSTTVEGKSVTALEIDYGLLADPAPANSSSRIYFRQLDYTGMDGGARGCLQRRTRIRVRPRPSTEVSREGRGTGCRAFPRRSASCVFIRCWALVVAITSASWEPSHPTESPVSHRVCRRRHRRLAPRNYRRG